MRALEPKDLHWARRKVAELVRRLQRLIVLGRLL